MNKMKNTLAVAGLALLCSSPSYSQIPDISALTGALNGGGMSAPSLDALPIGLDSLPGAGSMPGLDSLPVGLDSLTGAGALPGLDGLPLIGDLTALAGGLEAIPGVGPALAYIVTGDFLPRLLPSTTELGQLAGGQAVVSNVVLGGANEPQAVLSTVNELGVNAGTAAVPVLGVLMENPAGLVDYFVSGGTILTQSLDGTNGGSAFPGVPVLTQSFPLSM